MRNSENFTCFFIDIRSKFIVCKSITHRSTIRITTKEKLLHLEPSSSSLEMNEDKLKFFTSKIQIWDYANLSKVEYKSLLLKIVPVFSENIILI